MLGKGRSWCFRSSPIVVLTVIHIENQKTTLLENPRYEQLSAILAAEDPFYNHRVRDSFMDAVTGGVSWAGKKPHGDSSRPRSCWTVKQKCLISSVAVPIVKVRPVVTHSLHPMQTALRRVARALAILVGEARVVVMEKQPDHLPMCQLHSPGSPEWLRQLSRTAGWWGCDECDVSDCFLNTPREAVLAAVVFWLQLSQGRTRRQPCFAISKDGKAGDHRGKPSPCHYYAITAEQLLAVCKWDLEYNDEFDVQVGSETNVVVRQHRGLPIGGHLSAAYVELVALRREFQCPRPAQLIGIPTSRYLDNMFVVLREPWGDEQHQVLAKALSDLLLKPSQN